MKQKAAFSFATMKTLPHWRQRYTLVAQVMNHLTRTGSLTACSTDEIGEMKKIDVIYTYMPAAGEDGLSPAIYNRLIRAAGHTVMKL